MKKLSLLFIIVCLFISVPALSATLKPGKYEITTKVEMTGMSGMPSMPAQTFEQCITEEDTVPQAISRAEGCKIIDSHTKGDTLYYSMTCTQQGVTTSSNGSMSFHGTSFTGQTTTETNQGGFKMTIKTDITGKRLGDCN